MYYNNVAAESLAKDLGGDLIVVVETSLPL